ncbi:MAG: hypothetical protein P4M01_12890 [Acidobacteriota bacterium]|nr:hypothetical protein [Acidobacteriota bacterium]
MPAAIGKQTPQLFLVPPREEHARSWRGLLQRCANPECRDGDLITSFFRRATGFRVNETDWYCGERCMEQALAIELEPAFRPIAPPVRTTMPMGLMLLSRGVIADEQLREALEMHHATGDRIGACLSRMGCVSEADIASVVATQWGCAIFPAMNIHPLCPRTIPASLAERYRMLPVHFAAHGRKMFVGFSDRVNHSALAAIEGILGCETEPCIVPERDFGFALEQRKRDTNGEVTVNRPKTAMDVAGMICSYALQTGASALRVHASEGNIWARLRLRRSQLDLIFLHPPTGGLKCSGRPADV